MYNKGVMMNMKNNIRECLLTGLFILFSLFCSGCGADEEALFLEASGNSTVEEMHTESTVSEIIPSPAEVVQEEKEYIMIHVCGAVQTPGVYEVEKDSRVMDAVVAAGGFLPEADTEYVNLATVLADGNKVKIPTKDETTRMSLEGKSADDNGVTDEKSQKSTGQSTYQVVNINTADKELLCTLPGIGETRAESILAYRAENGTFSKIEDIMLVSGIKESSFQKIKNYITVN